MAITLTIIGSGPGGYVAAIRAAQLGARVTVVEDTEVGGTCLNRGCIPTKALLASAEALERVRHAAAYGVDVSGEVRFNLEKIRARRDSVVATQVKGIRGLLAGRGIALVAGRGRLLSPGVVRVTGADGAAEDLTSDRVIIATGSRPAALPGLAFDGQGVISSDEAVRLTRIPGRLLIVGAGVIGAEFAFLYRAFGAEVSLVEALPRALATEDEEISALIEREMRKAKITLRAGAHVAALERGADGGYTARLSDGGQIIADQVLVSVGRALNSEGIGLEELGVKTGRRGEILVDERMQTNVPGVYAIGDVTGKALLAHVASRQGMVAAENAGGGDSAMDYGVIPAAIFTMPEIGSVGLREREARERGLGCKVGRFQYRALGKAHAMGEIVGLVKIVAEEATDRVLGVHICGAHATDLVHEGALALRAGLTARQLGGMIHAHPTLAELIMEAAEDVHGAAIHAPKYVP